MKAKLCDILTDVSVREGSQQKVDILNLPVREKIEIVRLSAQTGIRTHEITAFAPGAWFGDSESIAAEASELSKALSLRALYFNSRGLDALLRYPNIHAEGMFHTAVTKGYREKNYRQLTEEDIFSKLTQLLEVFTARTLNFDTLVLSTVWGESGEQADIEQTLSLIERISARAQESSLPLKSVTLCDTEGQAAPHEVGATVAAVKKSFPGLIIRMHLHPAKNTAIESIHAAIDSGADEWEASWGGMGGSPFADTAGGNLDIRYLIKAWEERGLDHGFNLDAIPSLMTFLTSKITRSISTVAL